MDKIDVTAPKVYTPALLFAALSSGFVFFMQKNGSNVFGGVLVVNAIIFALLYYVILKFLLKKSLTRADIVVPLLLYIVLTPGVLLTLPPGSKGVLMSGQSSPAAVAVHTLVYAVVFALMRKQFPQFY
jgi:hypothetical protein